MIAIGSPGGVGVRAGARPAGTPAAPPELSGTIPRNVSLTAGGIVMMALAAAMAAGALASAIGLSIVFRRSVDDKERRARDGVAADARVEDVSVRRGEHPSRIVSYSYEADGRTFTGRVTFPQRDGRTVHVGDSLRIAYVRSQPDMSWMPGYEPGSGPPLVLIPILPLALIGGVAAIAWSVRRQWLLLSEGRVAQARVTGQKKVHSDKHHAWRVSYEFQALSGSTHTSHYDVGRNPPPIGTVVPIVYHRDAPGWSTPYPLQFVRPSRR